MRRIVELKKRAVKRTIIGLILVTGAFIGWYLIQLKGGGMDFILNDIEGNRFRLSDYRGRVVLIYFMATWCGECKVSMNDLVAINEEFKDRIILISISIDPFFDTEESMISWTETWNADWKHARDTADPPVSQVFSVMSTPTYVLLDKKGNIVFRQIGRTSKSTLTHELENLLNE